MSRRLLLGLLGIAPAVVALPSCGGAGPILNQTSITCPAGRTLLDGVCVRETVADYVACVRAQGAQLSADVGTVGVRASGSAEVKESLEKKYATTDTAALEIVRRCSIGSADENRFVGDRMRPVTGTCSSASATS